MTSTVTYQEKVKQLSYIRRLCHAKESGVQLDDVNSKLYCVFLFIILAGFCQWLMPTPLNAVGIVISAIISGVIVKPRLRERLRTTEEKIFTSAYLYKSPLSVETRKKHKNRLQELMKENPDDVFFHIKIWAQVEMEAIHEIMYSQSREGKTHSLLIEKKAKNKA